MKVSEIPVLTVVMLLQKQKRTRGSKTVVYLLLFLGIPYKVTVYTGDRRNAGTDAKVYIVMNRKTLTHKAFLTPGKFEQKSVDAFNIDGPEDMSPLSSLDIGHDNSGTAPGWFLDKVCTD